MMGESEKDTGQRVDERIDSVLARLKVLSEQVDNVAEVLTRKDAESVRRKFQAGEERGSADVS